VLRASLINGKYSVNRTEGPNGSAVPAVQAKRQGRLQRALANGWNQDFEVESQARQIVAALLEGRDGLERGRVERTKIRGGKTRGQFKFPANWKVRHAIKS
jgi:hypothetical protein